MADKKQVEQQYYSRPPKLGKWEGFKQFLWNSETSQFMGRTGSSWGKSLFFVSFFFLERMVPSKKRQLVRMLHTYTFKHTTHTHIKVRKNN